MSRLRYLFLLVVVLAVGVTAVTGTGGFSSATADRSAHVDVAGDQSAYLAFEQSAGNTTNGTTDLEVTVTNQFPGGTELSVVAVTVDGTTVDLAGNEPLTAGESATRTFPSVPCDGPVSVEATGTHVDVSFSRSVACT